MLWRYSGCQEGATATYPFHRTFWLRGRVSHWYRLTARSTGAFRGYRGLLDLTAVSIRIGYRSAGGGEQDSGLLWPEEAERETQ